jgi:4-hydroxybenzoate polyprenyltransferase
MRYLRAAIDFLLYADIWLAAGALALAAQTQWLLSGAIQPTPLLGFIFWSALALYTLHRLVGLGRLGTFPPPGRYQHIARFRRLVLVLMPIAALLAAGWFYHLPFALKRAAIMPALIALAYVAPLWRGRRLRDLPYLKIFLIGIAWSWITVYLPALELGLGNNIPMWLMALERFLFIFALTLPFDIRDLEIDRQDGVKTLAAWLGLRRAKGLALACLAAMLVLAALNHHVDVYSTAHFAALALSALATGWLITRAGPQRSDYYYMFALDGMMVLQSALLWLLPKFF